jgi:hypothetical protein
VGCPCAIKPIFDAEREMWRLAVLLKTRDFIFSVITDKSVYLLYLLFKEVKDKHEFPSFFAVELEGEQHPSWFSYISYYSM